MSDPKDGRYNECFEHVFVGEIISFFCQLKQCQVGNGDTQLLENHTYLIAEFKFSIAPLPDRLQTHVTWQYSKDTLIGH